LPIGHNPDARCIRYGAVSAVAPMTDRHAMDHAGDRPDLCRISELICLVKEGMPRLL
jgi:hypothetical protein